MRGLDLRTWRAGVLVLLVGCIDDPGTGGGGADVNGGGGAGTTGGGGSGATGAGAAGASGGGGSGAGGTGAGGTGAGGNTFCVLDQSTIDNCILQ